MDYESLMNSMEASAEEKKREILDKARLEASAIVENARVKADEIEKAYMLRAVESATRDRNRALYLAKSEARREIAQVKHEMFDRAFSDAKTRLSGMRGHNGYRQYFTMLANEAADALGVQKVVLEVDPRDEALCREAMPSDDHAYDIKPDLEAIGGLNASTPDGKIVVFNTIESRLGTARERLKQDIFSRLFGD